MASRYKIHLHEFHSKWQWEPETTFRQAQGGIFSMTRKRLPRFARNDNPLWG